MTLQSPNPSTAPLINPRFLSHPFDRRVLIEGTRELMRIQSAPVYANRTIRRLWPTDTSDDAIWQHIRGNLRSSWHMSCTAMMGNSAAHAVVDNNFNVFGVKGLRVVDMSITPFVINAHTQSVAYILGEIGADLLAAEYRLGEVTISGKPEPDVRGKL